MPFTVIRSTCLWLGGGASGDFRALDVLEPRVDTVPIWTHAEIGEDKFAADAGALEDGWKAASWVRTAADDVEVVCFFESVVRSAL